jgi:hypothetical protein
MGLALPIDLIPSACYDAGDGILSSATLETFEGSGAPAPPIADGVGAPVLVGRNRDLALTLDVSEVPQAGTLDVIVETAASAGASRWRTLGTFPQVSAAGTSTLTLAGADPFVRARYKLSAGAAFSFSVYGSASLSMLASAAQNASGGGPAVDMAQYRSARHTLDVTAITGTLTVTVETASSGSTAAQWSPASAPQVVTSISAVDFAAVNLDRFARVRWTLSGIGAAATFGVSGVARLVLATPADRARLGVLGGAFPTLTDEEIDDFLYSATSDVLGPFGARYEMPLRAWGDDTRKACISGGDWTAICKRGTEPGKPITPEQTTFYERYLYYFGGGSRELAAGWVHLVGQRKAHPDGILDSAAPERTTGEIERISVRSDRLRGWGRRVAIR